MILSNHEKCNCLTRICPASTKNQDLKKLEWRQTGKYCDRWKRVRNCKYAPRGAGGGIRVHRGAPEDSDSPDHRRPSPSVGRFPGGAEEDHPQERGVSKSILARSSPLYLNWPFESQTMHVYWASQQLVGWDFSENNPGVHSIWFKRNTVKFPRMPVSEFFKLYP